MRKNILVGIVLFLFIALFSVNVATTPFSGTIEKHSVSILSDYAVHDPILITSDADFVSQGWPGNGTESDPYIIENLWITQTVVNTDSIEIRDTTANVTVQNCYLDTVFSADPYSGDCVGIEYASCSGKGTFTNNTIKGFQFGLWANSDESNVVIYKNYFENCYFTVAPYYNKDNVTIVNNEFQECAHAIYAIGNAPSTLGILNNIIINSTYDAIVCQGSNHTLIQNNTCVNGSEGVSLEAFCYYTSVINNTFENVMNEAIFIEYRSANNSITWNNVSTSHSTTAIDNGANNTFDKNYWYNYDGYDLDDDGYGDEPYLIQGTAGSMDNNPRGPFCTTLVLDWHGGTWLDDTTFQQSALFGVNCTYYVYSPATIHTDLRSTYTGESGNVSAGTNSITIHVPDQFWGASIHFNTTNPSIEDTWYDCLSIGYSASAVWQNETTIGKNMRFDCRTFWTFLIDDVERESGIINDSRWSQEYFQFYFDKDLTAGFHTFSFRGKFDISHDYYDEFASGSYTVVYSPPEIGSIPDIEYYFDSMGNSITWYPTDSSPDSYEIRLNGVIIESDDWDGSSIIVNIDGLDVGLHYYDLTVRDAIGSEANDTVVVTVHEATTTTTTTSGNTTSSTTSTGESDYSLVVYIISIGSSIVIIIVVVLIFTNSRK